MSTIEVLIGMIGSGKSTYARKRAKDGALVVCFDDLTAMLHAEYRYDLAQRALYRAIEEAIVREALMFARDIVIDRTHLTRESRFRWIAFSRNVMLPACRWEPPPQLVAVTFPIWDAETHARRRHTVDSRRRSYEAWLYVAKHHAEQVKDEPLDWEAEGFSEHIAIDVPPWPSGLHELTVDYLARQE